MTKTPVFQQLYSLISNSDRVSIGVVQRAGSALGSPRVFFSLIGGWHFYLALVDFAEELMTQEAFGRKQKVCLIHKGIKKGL